MTGSSRREGSREMGEGGGEIGPADTTFFVKESMREGHRQHNKPVDV